MSSKSYLDDLSDISLARVAAWEQHGVDAIEADLKNNDGMRYVGGPPEVRQQAWRWVRAVRAAEAAPKLSDAVELKVPLAGFGSFNLKTAWRAIAAKLNGSRS
jgi:hypothetical protein